MAMEHQFIVPGSASLLKGRQGVIYEELGGLERQYRWKLGAMVELGTGAGGSIATDTLFDAAGDLVVGSGADTAARLAIGSAGQVLTSNGTTVAWANPAAGAGDLGTVASQAAMIALSTAVAGSICLRSDVGTGGTYYELFQAPYSSAANWQALQGTYADSITTLQLVAGKFERILYVTVPSGSGDRVTITVGGVTQPVLMESAQTHAIRIGDPGGVATPTTVTIQRTIGSGTLGTYSMGYGPAASVFMGDVPIQTVLIAGYPSNAGSGALFSAAPGTRWYVEDQQREIARSPSGRFHVPARLGRGPRFTGSTSKWVGMPGVTSYTNSNGVSRGFFRAACYEMPGGRESIIDSLSFGTNGGSPAAGGGTDEFDIRLYEAYADGSPIIGRAPNYVWKFNAGGTGGAGTFSMAGIAAGVNRMNLDLPGGSVYVPPRFWLGVIHNLGTAPQLSSPSLAGGDMGLYVTPAITGNYPDVASITPNRHYAMGWAENTPAGAGTWAAGATTAWDAAADWTAVAWACHIRVIG